MLDDSSLPRGDIEGCFSGICLCTDYLLPAVRCCSWGMDLAMHDLGQFVKGLVVLAL